MAVRSTMASIITRVRLLINDTAGASQIFDDQNIQNVLDDSRLDISNAALQPYVSFSGGTPVYLDYYHNLGSWEDNVVLKQFLTVLVTPSASEPIAGHWSFAATTLPPVYITGSTHDIYRAAADLLERWAARLVLEFDFTSDGQSFHRSQAATALQNLAKTYRRKQRPTSIAMVRDDIVAGKQDALGLGPHAIDYMAKG
jgi:hypothetical protein